MTEEKRKEANRLELLSREIKDVLSGITNNDGSICICYSSRRESNIVFNLDGSTNKVSNHKFDGIRKSIEFACKIIKSELEEELSIADKEFEQL